MSDATLSEQLRQAQEALETCHTDKCAEDYYDHDAVYDALALMPSIIERVEALEASTAPLLAKLAEREAEVERLRGEAEYRAIIWDDKRHAYWRPYGAGYTSDVNEAGLFSLREIAERNLKASCRRLSPYPPPPTQGAEP